MTLVRSLDAEAPDADEEDCTAGGVIVDPPLDSSIKLDVPTMDEGVAKVDDPEDLEPVVDVERLSRPELDSEVESVKDSDMLIVDEGEVTVKMLEVNVLSFSDVEEVGRGSLLLDMLLEVEKLPVDSSDDVDRTPGEDETCESEEVGAGRSGIRENDDTAPDESELLPDVEMNDNDSSEVEELTKTVLSSGPVLNVLEDDSSEACEDAVVPRSERGDVEAVADDDPPRSVLSNFDALKAASLDAPEEVTAMLETSREDEAVSESELLVVLTPWPEG